jgi:hypothetical protein
MQQVDVKSLMESSDFQKASPEAQEMFLSKYSEDFRRATPGARKAFIQKYAKNPQSLEAPIGDPYNDLINSQFIKTRPPEEARRLLSRSPYFAGLKPDKQDEILARLPGPAPSKSPVADELSEGVTSAIKGTFIDLPSTVYHAAKDKPTAEEIGRHRRHPNLFAEPQRGLGLTLDRVLLDPQLAQFKKADEEAQKGHKTEAAGYRGAGLLPLAGPMAAHFGEEIGEGHFYKALGEAGTYALMNVMTKGVTKDVKAYKRMSAAAGGGADSFKEIEPNLVDTARSAGRPNTIGELSDLIRQAGRDLETDFNTLLQPLAKQPRVPIEVASALLKEANSSHLLRTPEGRAMRLYLRQRALDYQRPWTLGELNKQRMDMYNARLENKTSVGQMSAMRDNAEIKANKLIEDSLRDIVYDDLTAHYGSSVNVRLLKKKQSQILDLQDRMEKRVDELADAQAEYDAAGPAEKIGLSISGHAKGATPHVHGIFKALQGGPETAANTQVRRAFPAKLKDLKTKADFKDFAVKQPARGAIKQSVRNLPLAALYEQSNAEQRKKKK